jgi:hypothetical protein
MLVANHLRHRWEMQRAIKHMQNHRSTDAAPKISSIFDIARRLETYHERLPQSLRFNNAAVSASAEGCEKIFALNCLYHTCVASLHASLVPVFSTSVKVSEIPKTILQASAQEALDQSSSVLAMASSFLDYSPDVSKVPSITGFCMFVCISIHYSYLFSNRVPPSFDDRFKSAMSILNILKGYWKPLQPLVRSCILKHCLSMLTVMSQADHLDRKFARSEVPLHLTAPGLVTDADVAFKSKKVAHAEISRNIPDVFTFVEREDSKLSRRKERPVGHSRTENLSPDDLAARSDAETCQTRRDCVISEPCRPWDIRIRSHHDPTRPFTEDSRLDETLAGTDAQDSWWDHQSVASSTFAILDIPLINHFHPV